MRKLKALAENPLAPLIISLIAAIISLVGLTFAYQAHELSVLQYKQERYLILKGSFGEKGDEIQVTSATSESHFLEGEVYFPPSIYADPTPIDSSGKFWDMGSVLYELENHILKRVKPEDGTIKMLTNKIPIIIKSYYASKGESYTDVSLYTLGMISQINDGKYSRPIITLNSLNFIAHHNGKVTITPEELDNFLNAEGLYVPARTP
ncbi:hypothetical protein [Pelobacter seleniigenes]|uniref:hypothetical protein n=1 Tax=Pelobacter seleniigenes TaxID=407188 RepID=UPI0004A76FB1|nr:hypothetical protein [Pelobacter seleniigenes]